MASSRSKKSSFQSRSAMSPAPPFQNQPAQFLGSEGCEDPRCSTPLHTVWYCVGCGARFCDTCWDLYVQHQPGRPARDGMVHERTVFHEVVRLQEIMNPPSEQNALDQMHEQDEDTTWFGITRDVNERPCLEDYETFGALMNQSPREDGQDKYPQLVSFVGQTSSGKSTLIKLLIDYAESRRNSRARAQYRSPVAGSPNNDTVPTSADVHLYVDPASFEGPKPILYADCEGLDAGEQPPVGSWSRRSKGADRNRLVKKIANGKMHALEWATTDRTKTRQFAVTELYPRLLYTFSDVVVFVLRNARTFETAALQKLLEWGSASLEKSINQPNLPHAIIAVNATDLNISPNEWNGDNATARLLASVDNALHPVRGVPEFVRLANRWRDRGKTIRSMIDLVHCYYSSFSVVRIPVKGRYTLLQQQTDQLYKTVFSKCHESYLEKKRAKMVSNSTQLELYIQSAFVHFSRKLENPFDFVEVSLRNRPIPLDFGGHILRLALAILAQPRCEKNGRWIFDRLSDMVASCVLLDCKDRPGLAQELFERYKKFFDSALEDFCNMYWPCDFANDRGRCVVVCSRHPTKGHQNAKGRIIASGIYQSSFSPISYGPEWRKSLLQKIEHLQNIAQDSQQGNESDAALYVRLHSMNIAEVFKDLGSASNFVSHATCFCCLMQPPEHALPCGHIICTNCAKAFGDVCSSNKISYRFSCCPLHPDETDWEQPFVIRFKPDHAGVRILSLDGGGIRGIVELEVLRSIENWLNRRLVNKIPIRAFFDLIVGTSTGGIISLALGVKGLGLNAATKQFVSLCDKAFTPREFHNVPLFDFATRLRHGSKYKSQPLYTSLKESLGSDLLFGGPNPTSLGSNIKVAVSSTDESGRKAIVLSNYNRQGEDNLNWEFHRPDDPQKELEVWEAGAATSAAAPYFKAYRNERSGRTYFDGALFHNNPVKVAHRERRFLWPDVADKNPDVFLSIGTSRSKMTIDKEESRNRSGSGRYVTRDETDQKPRSRIFDNWRQMITAARSRMDSILDAELAWKDFLENETDKNRRRYIRINPNIPTDVPQMDDKKALNILQNQVQTSLNTTESLKMIKKVVRTLVASSFYYERAPNSRKDRQGRWSCSGRLCCRFEDNVSFIRGLGEFLQQYERQDKQPFFTVFEVGREGEAREISLTVDIIGAMFRGVFDLGPMDDIVVTSDTAQTCINLNLYAESAGAEKYSISGFPRTLMLEDQQQKEQKPGSPDTLSPRLNAASLKRHSSAPSASEVGTASSQHPRSSSQPDLPLRNLLSSESAAWSSDALNTAHSDPTTPALDSDHNDAPQRSRLASPRRSFAHLRTAFYRSPAEGSSTTLRAPTDVNRASNALNKEMELTDQELEEQIKRAKELSIREGRRQHVRNSEYFGSSSRNPRSTIVEEPITVNAHFDSSPSPAFRSTPAASHQPPSLTRSDSKDEVLQKIIEISRHDRGRETLNQSYSDSMDADLQKALEISREEERIRRIATTPIPRIQVDHQQPETPPDEITLSVIEASRLQYQRDEMRRNRWP